jgi:hypothetical protein
MTDDYTPRGAQTPTGRALLTRAFEICDHLTGRVDGLSVAFVLEHLQHVQRYAAQADRLLVAGENLYRAGRWSVPNVSDPEAAALWEAFRDALGLAQGTATALGVNSLAASPVPCAAPPADMEKLISQILFRYVTDIGAGRYTMKVHIEDVAREIVAALRATRPPAEGERDADTTPTGGVVLPDRRGADASLHGASAMTRYRMTVSAERGTVTAFARGEIWTDVPNDVEWVLANQPTGEGARDDRGRSQAAGQGNRGTSGQSVLGGTDEARGEAAGQVAGGEAVHGAPVAVSLDPHRLLRFACMDCGLAYENKTWPIDVVLPDADWQRIHPAVGGVLCPACIVNRVAKLPDVTVLFARIVTSDDAHAFIDLKNVPLAELARLRGEAAVRVEE